MGDETEYIEEYVRSIARGIVTVLFALSVLICEIVNTS